jgi:hypothetical protein
MKGLIRYLADLKLDKAILWCYFIWYVTVVYFYFDPSSKIWLNSVGISAVIGTGLMLSISVEPAQTRDHWQTFRLYCMPFCVSSFSSLIKDRGFWVVLSPKIMELRAAVLFCMLFLLVVVAVKFFRKKLLNDIVG